MIAFAVIANLKTNENKFRSAHLTSFNKAPIYPDVAAVLVLSHNNAYGLTAHTTSIPPHNDEIKSTLYTTSYIWLPGFELLYIFARFF